MDNVFLATVLQAGGLGNLLWWIIVIVVVLAILSFVFGRGRGRR
jgi:hypothetical protein